MPGHAFPWTPFMLYLVLSLVDLVLTWMLVQFSDGQVYEGNPLAGAWLSQFGWPGLVAFKLLALLMVSSVTVLIVRRRPLTGTRVLAFACLVMVGVVLYSYHLLAQTFP
jgi:hypothetical protein